MDTGLGAAHACRTVAGLHALAGCARGGGQAGSCGTPFRPRCGVFLSHILTWECCHGCPHVSKFKKGDSLRTAGGNEDGAVAIGDMTAPLHWPRMGPPAILHLHFPVGAQTQKSGNWKDICDPCSQLHCLSAKGGTIPGPVEGGRRERKEVPRAVGYCPALKRREVRPQAAAGLAFEDMALRTLRQRRRSPPESTARPPPHRLRRGSPGSADRSSRQVTQSRGS